MDQHADQPEVSRLTRAVRGGVESDTTYGAVIPPIYLTSNFTFAGFAEPRSYDYSRSGNPTRDQFATALATLEGGAGATVTATGMAAVSNVVLALLRPGDTVLIPHDCYGGSWRLFDTAEKAGWFRVALVDFTDEAAVRAALAEHRPRLVWVETPSNPLMRITDIAAVAEAAHGAGALVAADNTFLTPLLQRPLELGADLVIHSTTKYLNGHSDVVGGAVVSRTPEHAELIAWWANVLGLPGSPFDSYLALRGLRTLHLRMAAHEATATAVAQMAATHPAVAAVNYPGLAGHPGHDLASRQQDGYGGMLSLDLAGGEPAVRAFVQGLRAISLAESLGGTESLVCHPATMTHASMTAEVQAAAGLTPGLIRLSLGLEATADLLADVQAGLDRAAKATGD